MSTSPDRPDRPTVRRLSALLAISLCLACSAHEEPEPLPSQTMSQVTPQLEPPPPLPPPIRELPPSRSSTVKVIEAGGNAEEPKTLAEASQLAKSRQQDSGGPVATINDENLHEYAEGAEVIVLESPPAAPGPSVAEPSALADETAEPAREAAVPAEARDEDYWRSRALELRMGWRRTVDRIAELELEAAALRQQFYAEEDPYLRDSQLKPAWDRVLDRLEQLRERSVRYEQEIEQFVEEGRRSNAPQGWLNQGWELEPTTTELERLEQIGSPRGRIEAHQAIEPPVYEEDQEP